MKSPNEEGREEGRKGDRERRKCEWGKKKRSGLMTCWVEVLEKSQLRTGVY